jgi:hypothetical protein
MYEQTKRRDKWMNRQRDIQTVEKMNRQTNEEKVE